MCFFNKLKAKDVQDCFDNLWKTTDVIGFPKGASRNSVNFQVSPYNSLKKDSCSHTMHVNSGKWRMHYNAYYRQKDKEVDFTIWYINLTISNPDLEKAIKQEYKEFQFNFMPSAVIVASKKYKVKNMEQVKDAFYSFIKDWNKSGVYELMSKFKTNEELKNSK